MNNKEYEMEAIQDSAVYTKKLDSHLPELYYLVTWKSYPKEENTYKSSSAVMHLRKMVSTFHRDYLEKPTATSALLDSVPPIAKSTTQLYTKRKRGQPIERIKKHAKWGDKEKATRKNPSQCGSRARSRWVVRDLSLLWSAGKPV